MSALKLSRLDALPVEEGLMWTHDGVSYVTLTFHEAMVGGLRQLHEHDLAWAKRVAAEHGIDLDALADADPQYRAEFRR